MDRMRYANYTAVVRLGALRQPIYALLGQHMTLWYCLGVGGREGGGGGD